MKIISIIPAKGTSKGMPGKNVADLCGHPLIAYSIKASLESKLIQRTICSTDSEQIKDIALKYGAEVPFIRPQSLAGDYSRDFEVFEHALKYLKDQENYQPDIIVQLRPTSPIRKIEWIDEAVKKIMDHKESDSLRSVCEPPANPYKMWTIKDDGCLSPLLKLKDVDEPYNCPRQLLPESWWQTGIIDITKYKTIMEKKSMTGETILPYVIDRQLVVDVDKKSDLFRAQFILKELDCVKFNGV